MAQYDILPKIWYLLYLLIDFDKWGLKIIGKTSSRRSCINKWKLGSNYVPAHMRISYFGWGVLDLNAHTLFNPDLQFWTNPLLDIIIPIILIYNLSKFIHK